MYPNTPSAIRTPLALVRGEGDFPMLVTCLPVQLEPHRLDPPVIYRCPYNQIETEADEVRRLKDSSVDLLWWRCRACGTWHLALGQENG